MASKKTKIGALIAIDGEQSFKASISRCKASVSAMKSELDALNSKYRGNANGMEALSAVQEKYAEIQSTAAKQVEKMSSAYEASAKKQGQIRGTLEDIGEAYDKAQKALDEMTASGEASEEQISAQEKAVEAAKADYETLAAALEKAETRTEQFRKALAEAQKAETEAATSAAEYAGYLEEAQSSPTGLAISIDGNGQKIKIDDDDLKDVTDEAEEASTAMQTFQGVLGGNFVTSGLEKVCDLLVTAGKYAIEVGSNFEAAMSKVEALSGATGGEYEKLAEKAKELGAETVYSATDAANAFSYMSLAGWDTEQMLSGIDGVLALAAASSMDLAEASSIVTDYITAFGLSAEDASHFADVMATAMSTANTDTAELGEAYKNCSATAGAIGYSVEDVTAVLATMANAGVKGGEAGTALNTVMTRLATNSSGCADALAEYGVAIYNADGSMKSLSDILQGVTSAFSGLTDQEQASLSKAIAGTSQYSSFQSILAGLSDTAEEGGKSFSDYAEALQNCDGAASSMAETMADNLQGDIDNLSSAAEGLGVTIYEAFSPEIRSAVQGLSDLIGQVTDNLKTEDSEMLSYLDDVSATISSAQEIAAEAAEAAEESQAQVDALRENIQVLTDSIDLPDISGYTKYQLDAALSAVKSYAPDFEDAFSDVTDFISADSSTRQAFLDELNEALNQSTASSIISTNAGYSEQISSYQQAIDVATQAMADMTAEIEAQQEKVDQLATAQQERLSSFYKYFGNDLLGVAMKAGGTVAEKLSDENTELLQAQNTLDELKEKYAEYSEAITETQEALEATERERKAYNEINADTMEALGIAIDENGEYISTLEDVSDASEDAATATDSMSAAAESATVSIEGLEDEQNEALNTFLSAADSVSESGFAEAVTDQMTEAATKVSDFKDALQSAFTIDPLTNAVDLDSVYESTIQERIDAIEKSVLDARWALASFSDSLSVLQDAGAPQEVLDELISRGAEDAWGDASTLAYLAENDREKFQEILGYWEDVSSYQDLQMQAEQDLLDTYTETIMDAVDGGYAAWYEYGIRTTQGLFDAIEEVQAALEDGGALESLGDFDTAFQSVLQGRAQVGNYAGANTQTQTTATATNVASDINITLTTELDGQKVYDTLIRYDSQAKKVTGTK